MPGANAVGSARTRTGMTIHDLSIVVGHRVIQIRCSNSRG